MFTEMDRATWPLDAPTPSNTTDGASLSTTAPESSPSLRHNTQSGWFPLEDCSSNTNSDQRLSTLQVEVEDAYAQEPHDQQVDVWHGLIHDEHTNNDHQQGEMSQHEPILTMPVYPPSHEIYEEPTANTVYGWNDDPTHSPMLHHDQLGYMGPPSATYPSATPPLPHPPTPHTMSASAFMHHHAHVPSCAPFPHIGDGLGTQFQPRSTRQKRPATEVTVGRWNAEEHKWFLKGLEMFQGPAWGDIARLIGTRTSTQVRTHAQKFFTKLARMNQTMPHFEAQIQKERTRLIAQGVIKVGQDVGMDSCSATTTSVTPTSTSAALHYAPLTKLSPSKHSSVATCSPRPSSLKRTRDESLGSNSIHFKSSPTSGIHHQDPELAMLNVVNSPAVRKPRLFIDPTPYEKHDGLDPMQLAPLHDHYDTTSSLLSPDMNTTEVSTDFALGDGQHGASTGQASPFQDWMPDDPSSHAMHRQIARPWEEANTASPSSAFSASMPILSDSDLLPSMDSLLVHRPAH